MRSDLLLPLALAALLTACGGNWSKEDLEFLNALPLRDDLEAKIPGLASSSAGLGRAQQGLGALGEEPELYSDLRKSSDNANRGLFALLEIVDRIRELPPTTREPKSRTWGPFPDQKQRGFDVRVVMNREAGGVFTWSIDYRPEDSGEGSWFTAIAGRTQTREGALRRSTGTVVLHSAEARARGLTVGEGDLTSLSITYDTASDPAAVLMEFDAPGGSILYDYAGHSSGAGSFEFTLTGDLLPARPGTEDLIVNAAWTAAGAGRAEAHIEGYEHLRRIECWNDAIKAVYLRNDFKGTEAGDVSKCPVF